MIEALFIVLIVTTLLSFAGTILHTMALNRMIFAFAQQNMSLSTYNAMVAAAQQGPERTESENRPQSGAVVPGAQTGGSTPPPVHPAPHIHVYRHWTELDDVTSILDAIGSGVEMFCETCLEPESGIM